ncbi:MAG: PilN domain-containing protein [Candidatus Eisenbacteria sp.]|nr:PilN domain-containing protein [Candidatus Eisenbacteria bacterium]
MISVNLLPKEERSPERQVVTIPRRQFLVPLGVVLALIVPIGSLYLMQVAKTQGLKADIILAEQESERLKPQIEKINQLIKKREELNLKLNLVRDLNRARTLPVQLLDELSIQVPNHLWLTKVTQNGPSAMTIEGLTFSNLVVADLMSRLERTDLYRDVDLTVAEKELIVEEKIARPLVRFVLTTGITR